MTAVCWFAYLKGDSGGALACKVPNQDGYVWVQFGVASYRAEDCREKGTPSVYIDLRAYADWVDGTIA